MTQKIDSQVFIDAAMLLLEKYAASTITNAEIASTAGCSMRAFYNSNDLPELWKDAVKNLVAHGDVQKVYEREKRCERAFSRKIVKMIEKNMKGA